MWFLAVLIFSALCGRTEAGAVVQFEFLSFLNPSGKTLENKFCDEIFSLPTSDCEPFFEVCIGSASSFYASDSLPCNIWHKTTTHFHENNFVSQAGFRKQLGTLSFTVANLDALSGAEIRITIHEWDVFKHEIIQEYQAPLPLILADSNWKNQRKVAGNMVFEYRMRAYCENDYFGINCTVHCLPSTGISGDYICDGNGNRIFRPKTAAALSTNLHALLFNKPESIKSFRNNLAVTGNSGSVKQESEETQLNKKYSPARSRSIRSVDQNLDPQYDPFVYDAGATTDTYVEQSFYDGFRFSAATGGVSGRVATPNTSTTTAIETAPGSVIEPAIAGVSLHLLRFQLTNESFSEGVYQVKVCVWQDDLAQNCSLLQAETGMISLSNVSVIDSKRFEESFASPIFNVDINRPVSLRFTVLSNSSGSAALTSNVCVVHLNDSRSHTLELSRMSLTFILRLVQPASNSRLFSVSLVRVAASVIAFLVILAVGLLFFICRKCEKPRLQSEPESQPESVTQHNETESEPERDPASQPHATELYEEIADIPNNTSTRLLVFGTWLRVRSQNLRKNVQRLQFRFPFRVDKRSKGDQLQESAHDPAKKADDILPAFNNSAYVYDGVDSYSYSTFNSNVNLDLSTTSAGDANFSNFAMTLVRGSHAATSTEAAGPAGQQDFPSLSRPLPRLHQITEGVCESPDVISQSIPVEDIQLSAEKAMTDDCACQLADITIPCTAGLEDNLKDFIEQRIARQDGGNLKPSSVPTDNVETDPPAVVTSD